MTDSRKLRIAVAGGAMREQDRILRFLGEKGLATVMGTCQTSDDTIKLLQETPVDILIVDVQLPPLGGFELLGRLPQGSVQHVVFLASTDEHALTAFQFHPLDFLIMPVDIARLDSAIRRVLAQIGPVLTDESGTIVLDWLKKRTAGAIPALRLMVKTAGRICFLRAEEIDYVEADRDYVRIHNAGKKHLLRERISHLEQQLPADRFLRIHRSTIVNIDRIKEMQPLSYGEYAVILSDGTRLILSRSFRERVFSRLVTAA